MFDHVQSGRVIVDLAKSSDQVTSTLAVNPPSPGFSVIDGFPTVGVRTTSVSAGGSPSLRRRAAALQSLNFSFFFRSLTLRFFAAAAPAPRMIASTAPR